MIPGLWYEFEVTTIGARVHGPEFDEQHLKRDGMILESRSRRWFDFRQKWVWDYIDRVMVDKLRADGFGYLKIDYNGNAGFGCDGAESAGEGMRQHTDAVIAYLRHVREIFPELIIENCASGGHRLAPAWLTASDQSSFSDAHECREIPLIAARLHHLILPRQSQIWATLHADDTPERLYYSFAATFLGRMCISGEVTTLDAGRWAIVTEAMAFYRKIVPIIRNGRSKYTNRTGESMRHPKGDQALIRFGCSQVEDGNFTCDDADEALIIQHSFEDPHQDPIVFELPPSKGGWAMVGQFNPHGQAAIKRDQIALAPLPSWEGAVFHLRRK
jgi:alpha-galactosidase